MSTIVAMLVDIAVRIGRSILEYFARRGYKRLLSYMRGRIRVFARRWDRAVDMGHDRRAMWNLGRIQRWTAAMDWLQANAAKVAQEAVQRVCELPKVRELPLYAACEKYTSK
jgi:hypothetical protein